MINTYDLIIIGAGPAGLSSAIYSGRAKLNTLVLDKDDIGGQIKITNEVVNYPGILETSGSFLTKTMKQQSINFGVKFETVEVLDVDFSDTIKKVKTNKGEFRSLSIIIATGARPRRLGFKGETEFAGRGVAYCATCDGEFFTGLDVFVIGAGFAAAEEAIFLTKFARHVYVIAREPEFTCSKTIADKVLSNSKITVHFNTEILELSGAQSPKKATFIDNKTNNVWEYNVEDLNSTFGVFVFVGYEPISEIFKNHIELDKFGYIPTNEDLKTNIEGVYAAGDIRPKRLRQLVTAVSDGAIASTSIERYLIDKKDELGISSEENNTSKNNKSSSTDTIFDLDLKNQIVDTLNIFENNISIVCIYDDSEQNGRDTYSFMKEFSEIVSKKITTNFYKKGENTELEKIINVSLYPTIAIFDKNNKFTGIEFHGVPSGHEFNSFILALYNVSGPGQNLDENIITRIKNLNKNLNIKICVSLSCSICPDVVTSIQKMASINNNIKAEMIELYRYPEIKSKYNIMSVPAIIINDNENLLFGKKNIEELLYYFENV